MAEAQAVVIRNVVVLGKTGAGKSTIANKISGIGEFQVKNVAGSVTDYVEAVSSIVVDEDSKIKYCFKVIDTIGVFDTRHQNDHAMAEIKRFFQKEVPEGVHLVLFVFRKGRFTEEEKRTFDFITENFHKQISGFSALVITACENDNEDARKVFVESFRSEAPAFARFMKKGIYTVGFPDLSSMKTAVREALEADMREEVKELQKIVMNADQKCLGNEMFEPNFWAKLMACVIL